jgi:hypothetical protein
LPAFRTAIGTGLLGTGFLVAGIPRPDRSHAIAEERRLRWEQEELEIQLITLTALRSEIGVRADTTCARFKRDCTSARACLLEYSDAACIDADVRMAGHPVLDSWWRQLRELSWSMYALEQQVRTSQWVRGAQVQSTFNAAE